MLLIFIKRLRFVSCHNNVALLARISIFEIING